MTQTSTKPTKKLIKKLFKIVIFVSTDFHGENMVWADTDILNVRLISTF